MQAVDPATVELRARHQRFIEQPAEEISDEFSAAFDLSGKLSEMQEIRETARKRGDSINFCHAADQLEFLTAELRSFEIHGPPAPQTTTSEREPAAENLAGGEQPAMESSSKATVVNLPDWELRKPKRAYSYAYPLYLFLQEAHAAGRPRPTAREVVEAWTEKWPKEVAKVLADGFDYYDANGDTKWADLDAIRKAIGRMTVQAAQ